MNAMLKMDKIDIEGLKRAASSSALSAKS